MKMKKTNQSYTNIKKILKKIKFKSLNLSFEKQLVLIWTLLWLFSLFLDWIKYPINNQSWNSFNSITWNIGYILLIIFLILIFIIFSTQYKEKIKLYSDLNFKNHFIIITSAFISFCFTIVSISFSSWLKIFLEKINYWNGPILCMISSILIFIWWILIRKEFYKNNSEIILEKLNSNREKNKKNDNMSLPI